MSSIIKSSYVVMSNKVEEKTIEQNVVDNELAIKKSKAIIDAANKKAAKIIKNATNESDSIIEKANLKSENIMENTYKKSKEIIEKAQSDGYKEGYKTGYDEGKNISDGLINEANDIKKDILTLRKKYIQDLEPEIINLVIHMCETILNNKLENDKELILSIIYKGLDSLNLSDNLIIIISQDDYEIVNASRDKILSQASLVENIDIKVDRKLTKGDCIIETESGTVNCSLNMQMNKLKETIIELLKSE
ncbi:FliH/SctL family protein [Abyssisolibacter fermentans]|uniref:FliH/SctL family protein n=1 Tax=Abyssisolibacter fermentans TaxID=1766203 RepID=UPI000831C3D1|nr:FliH/SctL family protein [Abyssisolibacter fermentans]